MSTVLKIADHLPHYTYEDYRQWEGRWEIIYGVAYTMSPLANLYHQSISKRIENQLFLHLRNQNKYTSFLPVDWQIGEDTIVQPDNCVVRGNPHGSKLTDTPLIIFEILSPATAKKDRGLKYQLYQEAGVPYYAIIDPDLHKADVFQLEHGSYIQKFSARDGKFTFALDEFSFEFNFTEIW